MDTLSLKLFVHAAEKLNISAAGRQLGLAPAVASARLAKLEQNLGAELLRRSTRKVSLSTEGAEFLPYAKEILSQEVAGRAALGLEKGVVRGTLRFACSSTFAALYVTPLLPEFLDRHRELSLDLRLSDSVSDVIEGSFDLALRNAPLADSSLKARKLADDERILCASPEYLKQYGAPSSPAELDQHTFLAFAKNQTRELIDPKGERHTLSVNEERCRLLVDDGNNLKVATVHGAGIGIHSRWSVHRELSDGALVEVLPGTRSDDGIALWLVYPHSNVLTAKVRVFIDYLLEKLGRNPPWFPGKRKLSSLSR